MIELTIPGDAIGKQRPRVVRCGKFARAYTPAKTVNYETLIKELFAVKYPNFQPMEGPLQMSLLIYCRIPKSGSAKKRLEMIEGAIRPTKRPDLDNIIKIFADSLNGLAYQDDAQIVQVGAAKQYSAISKAQISVRKL